MNILQINDNISDGSGVSRIIYNYYNELKDNINYSFYFMRDSKSDYSKKIQNNKSLIRYSSYKFNLLNIKKIKEEFRGFLKENSFDIVEIHCIHFSFLFLDICNEEKIPVRILHAHSSMFSSSKIKSFIGKIINFKSNRYANCYFSCSDLATDYWFKKCKPIYNIPNYIEIKDNFSNSNSIKNELHLNDKFVIGFVGRFSKEKNLDFVFKLIQNTKNPNYIYLMLGTGPLFNKFKDKIEKKGLGEKVVLLGYKSNVMDYYKAMNVMILPSKKEGLPVSVLEAQYYDVPCVVSDSITKQVDLGAVKYFKLDTNLWLNTFDALFHQKSSNVNKNNSYFDKKIASSELLNIYMKELENKNG